MAIIPLSAKPETKSRRTVVAIGDDIEIPAWVDDHGSFRRWAWSDEFPRSGQFGYFQGVLWADVSREELFTHNQVKLAFAYAIVGCLQESKLGRFVGDRMLWTNATVGLSTEPDGLFYTWDTMQSGRLRQIEGAKRGIMELEGTPDMALEVVSESSLRKDTITLRRLYWQAGVSEYWLVDAREKELTFDILRHGKKGYSAVPAHDDWSKSEVFGRKFRLQRQTDRLGDPQFMIEVK